MKKLEIAGFAPRTPYCPIPVAGLLACCLLAPISRPAEAQLGELENNRTTAHLAPRTPFSKALETSLGPGRDSRTLVVKLTDDGGVRVIGGRLEVPGEARDGEQERRRPSFAKVSEATVALNDALNLVPGSRIEPLFRLPASLLEAMRRAGERQSGAALTDLSQFFVLHVGDAAAGEVIAQEMLTLPAVETTYARMVLGTPVDVFPPTPNFHNSVGPGQGYRDPAPSGIDIEAAWLRGYNGQGVTVADVELSWNLAHEDLDHLLTQTPSVPILPASTWSTAVGDVDHGTATLGVLASGNNGYGTTGLIPGAKLRVMPVNVASDPTWNGAHSVVMATLNLQAGDVLLLEAEINCGWTCPNINMPFETDPAEYAAVAQATALGIHVIEPAGNSSGGLNLDTSTLVADPATGRSKFDRTFRDSGAVLVGAGASSVTQGRHDRYVNSNYGSRVDTYSWGQNVTTLGFGRRTVSTPLANCANLYDPFPQAPNQDQYYTHCYNGTSSAGAIVAGAAAVLEQKHRADYRQPYGTRELRNLLSLGTASTTGEVGHQPDLAYQMDFMDRGGLIAHLFEQPPVANQSGPEFGRAVAGGGDVDGDGRDDLIVGIPGFDVPSAGGPLVAAGRISVFSGATGRILYQLDGSRPGDRLGTAVAVDGDADGDGFADFVVGIPGDDTLGLDIGKVEIYSGASGTLMVTFFGTSSGELYGSAVAYVGNINPPGTPPPNELFDDVIVGAPGYSSGAGRSEVRNRNGWHLRSFLGGASDEHGFAVAGAGDLDGDNVPDCVVGAPGVWDGLTAFPAGAVFAYSGRTGGLIMSRAGNAQAASQSPQRFGAAVDGAGDFDGDGARDVVVGAPESTFSAGNRVGRVDVVSAGGQLITSFDGGQFLDRLGSAVAGLGDFDGDGYDDLALGSPNQGLVTPRRPGRVRVILGGRPVGMPPVWNERLFQTLDDATEWGVAVAAAGDVNGDGLADVIAGEPAGEDGGRAYVFTAGPGPDPFAGQARLIADVPAIEAHDANSNGFSGGFRSPAVTHFTLEAGPAWAGDDFMVLGIPDVGSYLQGKKGTLDSQGTTSMPLFGPFKAGLLCGGIGFRFGFIGAALRDTDGDGQYDDFKLSNVAEVEVINEYAPLCQ